MLTNPPIRCAHCGAMTRLGKPCSCGYATIKCGHCNKSILLHTTCPFCCEKLKIEEEDDGEAQTSQD